MLINPNGMLLSRFAERLVDDHVKTVIVSIDGRQKHHEEIRRKEGLFQEVLAGMRDVNRIKKRRGCAYPKIDVSTVILPQNYKELYEFLEDMDRLGVRSVTLDHLKFITRDQYEAQRKYIDERFGGGHPFFPAFRVEDVDKIGIGRDDLARQMERIERDRHKFGFQIRWARNFTSEAMADYYCEEFSGQADNMFCTTIFNCLTIGPYGDMSICYEYPLGNIADLSIREAWNGDRARLLRRSYLERRHGFPACTYCTNLNPR
jgi:MoaA/NifB/PqqE/SkfB family radical SAM enzyme